MIARVERYAALSLHKASSLVVKICASLLYVLMGPCNSMIVVNDRPTHLIPQSH